MPKIVAGGLTTRKCDTARPGLHLDGSGLYFVVNEPTGKDPKAALSKSWVLRYKFSGRVREMGLGPFRTVGLAEARDKARAARLQLLDGIDPLEARDAGRVATRLEKAREKDFRTCAEAYIRTHRAGWKNAKHASQWENTLETYAYPKIGSLPVSKIDTPEVTSILEPIWTTKAETANRLRGRIEKILDWATVKKYRSGVNPARWRGHLDHVFMPRNKVAPIEHHAALPFAEVASFIESLKAQDGIAPLAFQFIILTAARTSEATGATWDEIDFAERNWNIPASRMKAGKPHRVPLSDAATEILHKMKKEKSPYVFHGRKIDEPLSNMACLQLLKRIERGDLTTHGFRSSFRDWCAERTSFPNHVAEAALAHKVKGVEGDYRRGDLLEKRREMMQQWARYCETPVPDEKAEKAKVVQIGKRK